MEQLIITTVQTLIITGAGWLLKGYFGKKAENLATKNDIGDITREIESARTEYLKALEEHKSELHRQFETQKVFLDIKTEIFKLLIELKETLIKRKNKLGDELELNTKYMDLIVQICMKIGAVSIFTTEVKNLAEELIQERNKIVTYIDELRKTNATQYSINLDNMERIADLLQKELMK